MRYAAHRAFTLHNLIVICHTAANSDESYVDCQTHAAREVVNILSGRGPTTETSFWSKAASRSRARVVN